MNIIYECVKPVTRRLLRDDKTSNKVWLTTSQELHGISTDLVISINSSAVWGFYPGRSSNSSAERMFVHLHADREPQNEHAIFSASYCTNFNGHVLLTSLFFTNSHFLKLLPATMAFFQLPIRLDPIILYKVNLFNYRSVLIKISTSITECSKFKKLSNLSLADCIVIKNFRYYCNNRNTVSETIWRKTTSQLKWIPEQKLWQAVP
jgi:hypothetical protein